VSFIYNQCKIGKLFMKLGTHIKNAKLELAKVIFPTKGQVKQAYISVLIVVTVIAVFLALVDLMMSSIMSAILG
jgi:preprotein translocase subunit SecE